MKKFLPFVFAICAALAAPLTLAAVELGSTAFVDYLLGLKAPGAPEIFEDAVIFTAPSSYKRVGVAFAHESFSEIHWFTKLLVPINETAKFDPKAKIPPEMLRDSGILFYAYTPANDRRETELSYRLIIDGLWVADPLNPRKRYDFDAGAELSVMRTPAISRSELAGFKAEGILALNYNAESGETIYVAGDFNGWDPFMYKLKEISPGNYSLRLPLPPGEWRYNLFHRGRRVLDPSNLNKVYARDGMTANVITIE
jgi:hypothetical protein